MKQRKKHVEEGEGFISDSFKNFANKTRDIAKKVIYGRNELPPKVHEGARSDFSKSLQGQSE